MKRLLALFLVALTMPGAARAGLDVCNQTPWDVSVAIGYKADLWTSEGWWNVGAGDCKTVVGGDLKKQFYYYRISSDDYGFEGENYYFCTTGQAFTIPGDTDCKARGYRRETFSELDTGEAVQFTLNLTAPGRAPAPAPSGDVDIQSNMQPGQFGEPFSVRGVFQGCIAGDGDYFCDFHAEGWRWIVYQDGRTPGDIYDALTRLPTGTPVHATGDLVSYGDITTEAMLRGIETLPPDRFEQLLQDMQGRWISADDASSSFVIDGSERINLYSGDYMGEEFLRVAETCDDAAGAGDPVLIATDPEDRDFPFCYGILRVTASLLELMYLPGGNILTYVRGN